MFRKFMFAAIAGLLLITSSTMARELLMPGRVFTETVLTSVAKGWIPKSLKISSDGYHVGYILQKEGQKQVVVDGVAGPLYEDILDDSLIFAPNNKIIAYFVKKSDTYVLVTNGQERKAYQGIKKDSLVFSSDSRRLAFIAKKNEQWVVINNEQESALYDDVMANSLKFSPDGKHLVYAAQKGGKWYLVKDGKPGKAYDGIRNVEYSPDSRRLAMVIRNGSHFYVELDGTLSEPFEMIRATSLKFSPNSQRLAFIAQSNGKQLAVIDGQKSVLYEQIGVLGVVFSPDSKQTAFIASDNKKWFVVTNGQEGFRYDRIMEKAPVFSPDSRTLVYAAQSGSKWMVVKNNKELAKHDGIGDNSLTFSPDGRRFAYMALKKSKWTVVVDEIEGRLYDAIGKDSLKFSLNGQQIAYSARRGNDWFMILNGSEGRAYRSIITGTGYGVNINFDTVSMEYLSVKDNQIILVSERTSMKDIPPSFSGKSFKSINVLPPSNKSFTFKFNPADGTSFTQTIRQTVSVVTPSITYTGMEREEKWAVTINRTLGGFIYNKEFLSLKLREEDKEVDQSELIAYLQKLKISISADNNGKLMGAKVEGPRRAPSQEYSTSNLEEEVKKSWRFSVEGLVGRSFKIGDSGKQQMLLPLPNGESTMVDIEVSFAQEVEVDGHRCVLLNYKYQFISDELKRLISAELRGIDGISSNPNVKIEMVGNELIDPNTLLNYGSEQSLNVKMNLDPAKMGASQGTLAIKNEIIYDYR